MKKNGFIKEIIVVIVVIYTLVYFNIDPHVVWDKIIELWGELKSAVIN